MICNYNPSRFGATVAMDIMRTHPLVIIGGLLRENPFFVPPEGASTDRCFVIAWLMHGCIPLLECSCSKRCNRFGTSCSGCSQAPLQPRKRSHRSCRACFRIARCAQILRELRRTTSIDRIHLMRRSWEQKSTSCSRTLQCQGWRVPFHTQSA